MIFYIIIIIVNYWIGNSNMASGKRWIAVTKTESDIKIPRIAAYITCIMVGIRGCKDNKFTRWKSPNSTDTTIKDVNSEYLRKCKVVITPLNETSSQIPGINIITK